MQRDLNQYLTVCVLHFQMVANMDFRKNEEMDIHLFCARSVKSCEETQNNHKIDLVAPSSAQKLLS